MSAKVRIDAKNPRILHMEWTNEWSRPMTAFALGATLKKTPSHLLEFKMFMVTRRSIVNPGEVCKFRIELSAPANEYPSKSFLQLDYKNSTEGWWQPKFILNPEAIETN